jgi:signal peptidase I
MMLLVAAAAILLIAHLPTLALSVLVFFLVFVVYGVIAWHAQRTARAARAAPAVVRPRPWVVGVSLAAFLIGASSADGALRHWVRRNIMESFRIPGGSMEPTVLQGDYVLVVARRGAALKHDQLAVYRFLERAWLTRLVALSGDTIEMRDGLLYRNEVTVAEPYAQSGGGPDLAVEEFAWQRAALVPGRDTAAYRPTRDTWGPLIVPAGKVFVLGDNRHGALDSRYVGFIAADSVTAKPKYVYLSRGRDGRVRWERLGHRFD